MLHFLVPIWELLGAVLTIIHKLPGKVNKLDVVVQIELPGKLFVAYSTLEHVDFVVEDRVLTKEMVGVVPVT